MSSRFKKQDATGVWLEDPPQGKLVVTATAAPTAAASGFLKGCIYINTSGSLGSIFYINVGSNTSATWLAVT